MSIHWNTTWGDEQNYSWGKNNVYHHGFCGLWFEQQRKGYGIFCDQNLSNGQSDLGGYIKTIARSIIFMLT